MGGGGDTQTVQKSDPWAGQQPYLQELFKQASNYYLPNSHIQSGQPQIGNVPQGPAVGGAPQAMSGGLWNTPLPAGQVTQGASRAIAPQLSGGPTTATGGPQYYPGQTIQPLDPRTTQGLDYATMLAQQRLPQLANQNQQALTGLYNAADINNNPNLQAAITAATEPTIRQFTDAGGVLSQIRNNGVANGNLGGTRQGIAEGIAMDRLSQNTMNIGQQMAQQAYQTGLDAQARGLALAPNVSSSIMAPATTLDAVGQENRGLQQQFIDDQIQRWNYNQQLPGNNLAAFQNLINGGFGGTSTSTANGGKSSPILTGLGGAAAGYSMATMMPALGMTGPVGAGIGLMAGLLLSN